MATQAEYAALVDAERALIRERRGLRPRTQEAERRVTSLRYGGRSEDDPELSSAASDLDRLKARRTEIPDELLSARLDRLGALETLLRTEVYAGTRFPREETDRRRAIVDYRDAASRTGASVLDDPDANSWLRGAGLEVTA